MNNERRNHLQTNHPVELLIRNVIHEVEKLGAHEVLTNAVIKLDEARNSVGDYIDWHPELSPKPSTIQHGEGEDREKEKAIEDIGDGYCINGYRGNPSERMFIRYGAKKAIEWYKSKRGLH